PTTDATVTPRDDSSDLRPDRRGRPPCQTRALLSRKTTWALLTSAVKICRPLKHRGSSIEKDHCHAHARADAPLPRAVQSQLPAAARRPAARADGVRFLAGWRVVRGARGDRVTCSSFWFDRGLVVCAGGSDRAVASFPPGWRCGRGPGRAAARDRGSE